MSHVIVLLMLTATRQNELENAVRENPSSSTVLSQLEPKSFIAASRFLGSDWPNWNGADRRSIDEIKGDAYRALGEFELAMRSYRLAYKAKGDKQIAIKLASMLANTGDTVGAKDVIDKLSSTSSKFDTLSCIAYVNMASGDVKSASENCDKAIAIAGDSDDLTEVLAVSATASLALGNLDKAEDRISRYFKSLGIDPPTARMCLLKGQLLIAKQRVSDGQKWLATAHRLAPESPIAFRNLASIEVGNKNYTAAYYYYYTNLQRHPARRDCVREYLTFCWDFGFCRVACPVCASGVIQLDDHVTRQLQGSVYLKAKEYRHSILAFEGAIKKNAHDEKSLVSLVLLYSFCPDITLRNLRRARDLSDVLCEQQSNKVASSVLLKAIVRAANGQFDEATAVLATAEQIVDTDDDRETLEQIRGALRRRQVPQQSNWFPEDHPTKP